MLFVHHVSVCVSDLARAKRFYGEVLGLHASVSGKPYELTAETLQPCQLDFIKREDFLQVDHVIQLGREPNRIDILTGISGVTFDEAWDNREQGKITNAGVFVISRDLLIKNKQAANRDKDQGDIKLLERTRR